MTTRLLTIFALALSAAAARPAPLDALFPPGVAAELQAGGTARRTFRGAEGLAFFPRLPLHDETSRRIAALEPTIGVEMAVSYKPTRGPAGGDRRTIYNALNAVSSLKGIEYFSASRGRMRTFFYDAAFVETAEGDRRLPDPTRESAPGDGFVERRYASLEDSTFGRYVVEATYRAEQDSYVLGFQNAGTIRKMLISFVKPGELVSTIAVVPTEDRIVLYGFSCVRAPNVLGLVEAKGEDSFTNRLVALMTWFRATYEATY
jgi:hypothetical protein